MRTLFQSLCGFFLVLTVCVTAVAAEEGKAEKSNVDEGKKVAAIVQVDERIHNFGQVSQGEVVRHDFKVLNKGDAILEIKSVKPG